MEAIAACQQEWAIFSTCALYPKVRSENWEVC